MMHEKTTKGRRLSYKPVFESDMTAAERARIADALARQRAANAGTARLIASARCDVPGFDQVAKWVVARVKPHEERIVSEELTAKGISNWRPIAKRRQPPRHGKKSITIERPIFQGYLFIRLVPSAEAWVGALCASRLSGYLGRDGLPVCLPDSFIKALKVDCKKPGLADIPDKFPIGSKPEITSGPFTGFLSTVEKIKGNGERLKVEVNVFGRATLVEVGLDQLKLLAYRIRPMGRAGWR